MQYEIRKIAGLSPDMTPQETRTIMSRAGINLAKEMLSAVTGKPENALSFIRDENGKPGLSTGEMAFNISHSGDRVLCAVHSTPIGVDIEQPGEYRDRVAKRICTPEEYAYIGKDATRFLEVWTRKEAYAKFIGRGLSITLKSVVVADSNRLLPEINGAKVITDTVDGYIFSIVFI